MAAPFRASIRIILFIIVTFCCVASLAILNGIRAYSSAAYVLKLWHRSCLRIMGFNIHCHPKVDHVKGAVIIANHASYMDILVIGSLIDTAFTPKSNIRYWPIIGIMVSVSRPIYINRNNKRKMKEEGQKIINALHEGRNIKDESKI